MAASTETLPFHLSGNFAPVLEERTTAHLEVIGALPEELHGTYVRNGPNPKTGTSPAWFAGEGMLHGVRLEAGRARWYRNRWIHAAYAPNTNVVRHAGRILSLVETRIPIEVTADLETVGPFDFGGELASMTAHPKACPRTVELLFFSYGREVPHLTFFRANAAGRVVHRAPIRVPAMTYMHDFAITERRAVFFDLPVIVVDWRSPEPVRWDDDYRARLGVVPRDGADADVRWFDIEPCTISHTMNAYDDGDTVVLDVVRASRPRMPTVLHRYELDMRSGRVREHALDSRFVDFPRINPAFEGRLCRHGYAVELGELVGGTPTRATLRKYDLARGASIACDLGPGRVPGECVIVPRAGATADDDAWAVLFVFDEARGSSDLVVLDAQRFDSGPVATVRLPWRIPFGIHGAWLPDEGPAPVGAAPGV